MAGALEANLAMMAALASLGFGLVLGVVGFASSRRIGSAKLGWVSGGFLVLAAQGGLFAWRVWHDRDASSDVLVPAALGFVALLVLYVAVYRRP